MILISSFFFCFFFLGDEGDTHIPKLTVAHCTARIPAPLARKWWELVSYRDRLYEELARFPYHYQSILCHHRHQMEILRERIVTLWKIRNETMESSFATEHEEFKGPLDHNWKVNFDSDIPTLGSTFHSFFNIPCNGDLTNYGGLSMTTHFKESSPFAWGVLLRLSSEYIRYYFRFHLALSSLYRYSEHWEMYSKFLRVLYGIIEEDVDDAPPPEPVPLNIGGIVPADGDENENDEADVDEMSSCSDSDFYEDELNGELDDEE
jgi:hypothetical protein